MYVYACMYEFWIRTFAIYVDLTEFCIFFQVKIVGEEFRIRGLYLVTKSHAKPPYRTRGDNELESVKSTQLRSREQRWILSAIIGSFWIEIALWGAREKKLGILSGKNSRRD